MPKKGKKLSADQKRKMQEGRRKRAEKAREGLADAEPIKKEKKKEVKIIGYVKDGKSIMPVFESEKGLYKKVFKSVSEAKED